jgi:enediyne biosynthesis protein CalE5
MPTPAELTQQQREQWSAAALGWERWSDWFDRHNGDLAGWLVDAAGIRAGQTVLDLACGAGALVGPESERVGAQGHVVATDFSPEMVAVTRRRVERLGLRNVEVREMDAQAIDFPDAAFDAATCRFGLMFCPDPVRAASEIRRVLRPGGRFALAVWDVPAKNPFFTALHAVVSEFMPMPPPDPTAPGVFRLAPPGELEHVLRDGGFVDVQVEQRPITMAYASPAEYWQIQTDLAAPLRAAIATLGPDELARLEARALEVAAANVKDGTVQFAAVPLCATAR